MGRGKTPGEFEQIVLLALAGFQIEATGKDIYEVVTGAADRDVSVAAVHITLGRLEEKGWAICRTIDPEPGVGGKPRRRYTLSPDGARVLNELRSRFDRLWGVARAHPLLGDE